MIGLAATPSILCSLMMTTRHIQTAYTCNFYSSGYNKPYVRGSLSANNDHYVVFCVQFRGRRRN